MLLASGTTALGIIYLCHLSIHSALVLMLFLLVSVSSSTLVVFPANVFSRLSPSPYPNTGNFRFIYIISSINIIFYVSLVFLWL